MVLKRKEIKEPWLSWIMDGQKTYEGRLNHGFWNTLKENDRFVAYSDENEAILEVTEILSFSDFGDAWNELGTQLIPHGASSEKDVQKFYSKWYSDQKVADLGVIAIGVRVV